jgi:hypothetical protein
VPDAATIDTKLARKLASTVRLLASNKPNEVVAAAQALGRILQGTSTDVIFGIAERIENESNGKISDAEMKEIFDAGVAHGKKLGEQARAQAQQAHAQMPPAYTMANFCFERKDRMNDWEWEFITNILPWSRRGSLSPKQQNKLEDIYVRLGGSV